MKKPIAIREQVIVSLVKQELNSDEAAKLLGCTKWTLSTYVKAYLTYGVKGQDRAIIISSPKRKRTR